jgi:hypothetical protein
MKSPGAFSPSIAWKPEPKLEIGFPQLAQKQSESILRSIFDVIRQDKIVNYCIPFFSLADNWPVFERLFQVLIFIGEFLDYRVIGGLMRYWKPEFLVFSIYSRFAELLEAFTSNSLLFNILFNFAIW